MGWADYMAAAGDEAQEIDAVRPGIRFTPSRVQQQDNPGEDLQTGLVNAQGYHLPDPTVGGQYGSKIRNAMTFGLVKTRRQTSRPFTGQVVAMPATNANPVQGNVGRQQGHQDQLSAGVRDQLTSYTGSLKSFAQSLKLIGQVTPVGGQQASDG